MPEGTVQMRPAAECRWDVLSLGEVMLRFDPGEQRITQARHFAVWEGGGEYNVARGLSRCFRQRAAIATALVDNPVGRLIEGLMLQGGVDVSPVLWREHDGIGQAARNGLYFLERGFGLRGALGSMDRGHTAIAQLQPGDIDWQQIFGVHGVRVFHTGGIFCALSDAAPAIARQAMEAARAHGTLVSFDCNYRPSLWKSRGGRAAAARINQALLPFVDVLFGHEGDLACDAAESAHAMPAYTIDSFTAMAERVRAQAPSVRVLATTVRTAHSATRNDWAAYAHDGEAHSAPPIEDMQVLDRVGGGDGFAAGLLYGLLTGRGTAWALHCGLVHGALVMTTPGDTSFATLDEVLAAMRGDGAGVQR